MDIRAWNKDGSSILEDLLYEAIFIPEGVEPPPRDIIKNPEIDVYIRDLGSKKDDLCLFATIHDKIIGGVWVHILAGENVQKTRLRNHPRK